MYEIERVEFCSHLPHEDQLQSVRSRFKNHMFLGAFLGKLFKANRFIMMTQKSIIYDVRILYN